MPNGAKMRHGQQLVPVPIRYLVPLCLPCLRFILVHALVKLDLLPTSPRAQIAIPRADGADVPQGENRLIRCIPSFYGEFLMPFKIWTAVQELNEWRPEIRTR